VSVRHTHEGREQVVLDSDSERHGGDHGLPAHGRQTQQLAAPVVGITLDDNQTAVAKPCALQELKY
jgi:hypothetical protein